MDHGAAYNYERNIETTKKRLLKDKRINKKNKKLVFQFPELHIRRAKHRDSVGEPIFLFP